MAHTASSQPGAGRRRAMSAETMKMPEPIIEPATSAVASRRPSRASRPVGSLLTSPPPREADRRARHARAPAGGRHRLHRQRDLGRGLSRHRPPHGDRERLHPAPLGDHHAVRGLPRVPRRAGAHGRRGRGRRRLRAGLARRVRGRGGRPAIERWGRFVLLGHRELELAERWFARWGRQTVFWARLLPVVRTFIALPAGIAQMELWPFVWLTFAGSLPWCWALAYAGFKLAENWNVVHEKMHGFDTAVGVLVALVLAAALLHRVRALRTAARQHPPAL